MHAEPLYTDSFEETAQPLTTLVVVADADARRRDALAQRLLDDGYDVVALETGPQLLQYLYNSVVHQLRPDLVICAAELEGIDGVQVCKISRAQDNLLPFIVLTRPGHAGAFDALELADDASVLSPDVDFEVLREEVSRLAGDP